MINNGFQRPLFCELVKEILDRKDWVEAIPDDQKSRMGVYRILCLVNGKVYVGSTINFRQRWGDHRKNLNRNRNRCRLLQKEWNEYGSEAFVWEILEYVYNPNVLIELEDEWINRFKSTNRRFGFNLKLASERLSVESLKKIAESNRGKNHNEKSKQKMREAKLGKKLSEETKQKMREAHLGIKPSEETKQKRSKSMKGKNIGKKRSEETKQKISKAGLGRKPSEETKKKISTTHVLRKKMGFIEEEYRNRPTALLLEYRGEVRTQAEWSRIKGIPVSTIRARRRCGWSIERILTTGVRPHVGI